MAARYPLFVKRDLDGFFGLAVDNLVQMLLIVTLCGAFCGMTGDNAYFITKHILPGVAVSLLIGNIFYALQAHWVAWREKRSDVTALPYGINTPSLLVYVFFVMIPAYNRILPIATPGEAAKFAWQMGLIACLGSGVIEFTGAFVAERLRRNTPRAALLSTLAGIAITFIAMKFALEIWERPLVAMAPMAIILLVYFAHVRFPLGLPGGFVAVLLGTALAWLFSLTPIEVGVPMSVDAVREAWAERGQYLPAWAGGMIVSMIKENPAQVLPYLSVIIPMGLFNVIGSLQNIESAEAGGDVFATGPSLAVNGIGTIAAALFGSCFPTTIYIGHPGWKALGARAGYSTLNGLVMTAICLTGTVTVISKVVPVEAGIAIVLWIGIVITAQAFQTTPVRHAPAVAIGLFPAIAAWGATLVAGTFIQTGLNTTPVATVVSQPSVVATAPAMTMPSSPASVDQMTNDDTSRDSKGTNTTSRDRQGAVLPYTKQSITVESNYPVTMQDLLESPSPILGRRTEVNGFLVHGMNIMERGYIFTCMIVAAISAFLIDRRFYHAAGWSLAAAVLTFLGLMHAYQLSGNVVDYWLIGTTLSNGVYVYSAYPIVIGYLLMAGVFIAMGYLHRHSPASPAHTIEDARATPE